MLEVPPDQLGDRVAAQTTERLDRGGMVDAGGRRGQAERGRMIEMAGGIAHGYKPAKGAAQHDRALQPDRLAERNHVVSPGVQRPGGRVTAFAAAVAALVKVDDLGGVGKEAVGGLGDRRVGSGTAVQRKHGRPAAHPGPVHDVLRAVHIEPQPHVTDLDPHRTSTAHGDPTLPEGLLRQARFRSWRKATRPDWRWIARIRSASGRGASSQRTSPSPTRPTSRSRARRSDPPTVRHRTPQALITTASASYG